MSPFFGNHGNRSGSIKNRFNPLQSATSPATSPSTPIKKNNHLSKGSNSFTTKEDTSEDFHAYQIKSRNASPQSSASTRKRSTTATYKVGDEVYLSSRSYVFARPVRRLDQPYEGPFRITKVINSQFYQLELPDELDPLHNAFHAALLSPVPKDPLLNLTRALPTFKATDPSGNKLWAVEKVVDTKRPDGKLYYFVRWKGPAEREKVWEPSPNLVTAIVTKVSTVKGQIVTHKIFIILL